MAVDAFGIAKDARVGVFIDGANLYATTKALSLDIDYGRLRNYFQEDGSSLISLRYYTAMVEDQEYSSIRPLLDWLGYNGFKVLTKTAKEFTDSQGRRKVKGNMDIDMTVDAMELAPHIDHMVLFSGDGDFKPLIEAMQRKGIRVTVASTISTQPAMIADDLRRVADHFTDIDKVQNLIARDPGARNSRSDRSDRRPQRDEPQGYSDQGAEAPAFLATPARSGADDDASSEGVTRLNPSPPARVSLEGRAPRSNTARQHRA
jgi:uncharacterized LabA/DUF88 family protein